MNTQRNLRHVLLSSCCFTAAIAISSPVANAATYTVPTGATQTVATQITGTDNVLLTGGGTLILTNLTNNYTGGSQIVGGSILQINSDSELGAANGALTFGDGTTAGTLAFSGATTIGATRAISLNTGSQTINTGSFTDTIAGAMTGSGALVKTGSGTLVLAGANTYSGSTTISAGTLQIGTTVINNTANVYDTTAAITSASIVNNGTLIFNRGDGGTATPSFTYSGLISGTGAVRQLGYGTVVLTANNTYTGVTTVTGSTFAVTVAGVTTTTNYGATLQLGDGGTTGWINSASVVTGTQGVLAFNRSDNVTWAGVVSGAGGITKLGNNVLTITGVNTLSGPTTISSGSLLVTGTGSLAASAVTNNSIFDFSGITAAGLTIRSLGGATATANTIMGDRNLTLTSGATYAGVLSGTGNLIVAGGTEILSGANTYTGTTTITGGTLAIGANGPTGSITSNTIIDNGTLRFNRSDAFSYGGAISGTGVVNQAGTGTLTLNNVYTYTGLTTVTAAGTLVLGDASHPTASVAGGATVGSATSAVGTLAGYGTIAGAVTNFGTVSVGIGSVGALRVGGNYTQTGTLAVEVSPAGASVLRVGGTATVAGTFRASFDAGHYTPAILPVLTATSVTGSFTTFSGTGQDVAYGVTYPSATEVDVVIAPKWTGQIYGDLATVALDNATGMNDIAVDHAAFDGCGAVASTKAADCQGWTTWAEGIGGVNHMSAADGADAFNAHNRGVIGGVGYRFSEDGSLNAAIGYTASNLAVSGGSARADTDSLYASLTLQASGPTIAIDANAFYIANASDVTRATGLGGTTTSTVKQTGAGFTFEVTAPLLGGDLTPLAKVTYAFVSFGPFAETGSTLFNLNGTHGQTTSGRFALGARLSHVFSTNGGIVLQPHLTATVEDDSSYEPRAVTMALTNFANTSFTAPSPGTGKVSGALNVGLDAKLDQSWMFHADFYGRHSTNQDQGTFSLGASYHF